MNYIIIETNGARKYWSMYGGGFTNDERDAMKFTDREGEALKLSGSAAEMKLKQIHETAKNPQYAHWKAAKIMPVDQAVLVTY